MKSTEKEERTFQKRFEKRGCFLNVVQLRKTYQDLLSCRDDQLLIANLGYLEASAKQGSRNDNAIKTIEELLIKRRKRKKEYLSYERREMLLKRREEREEDKRKLLES